MQEQQQEQKGKGNDSKPNQTTNEKQELKFAPVGRNGNFAPYNTVNTVKEAHILEVQSKACKAMVPLIDSIRNEKEPDWDSIVERTALALTYCIALSCIAC